MRAVFEVNVFGVVAVTNAMLSLLHRAEAARIVNVSSEVGSLALALDQSSPMWQMIGLNYPVSKSALNMIAVEYAKELWNTATDLNANTGFKTPEKGARIAVELSLIGADGPTAGFFDDSGIIPW
jgi:NAD(P)-dependent dehydrogenase (short-subunit alcohol dehydrogenase family)